MPYCIQAARAAKVMDDLKVNMLTLHFGEWGHSTGTQEVEYLETQFVPRSNSVSGYGSKLPTRKMVKYGKRWYRVYCACYSNAGTCYIIAGGKKLVID